MEKRVRFFDPCELSNSNRSSRHCYNQLLTSASHEDVFAEVACRDLMKHFAVFSARLNERACEILSLWILGHKLHEIAEQVGMSLHGVAAARYRATALFEQYLRKQQYALPLALQVSSDGMEPVITVQAQKQMSVPMSRRRVSPLLGRLRTEAGNSRPESGLR